MQILPYHQHFAIAKRIGYSFTLAFLLFLSGALFTACNHKDVNGPEPTQSLTSTTIVGEVVNESGNPVVGASVTAHGQTTVTDVNGLFAFPNIQVPSDRCFAIVKQNGYFNGIRAERTKSNGVTRMQITMGSKQTTTLNSASGGTVNMGGNASVQLQANSFMTKSGSAYTGQVTVAYKHLTPDDKDFFGLFPGDFEATRADNSRTILTSYGVLQVELSGANGEELQITSNKPATLTYPIPSSVGLTAPASIPLWYFDEQLGMWKEEGTSTKVGNTYVGTVTHFTPWNCDYPGPLGYFKAHIVCGSGPLDGVVVRIGQWKTITGPDGTIEGVIPADQIQTLSINAEDNEGMYSLSTPIPLQISANETKDFGNITLDGKCPARIIGQIVGCDNKPRGGIIYAKFEGKRVIAVTLDGNFSIRVPAGVSVKLSGASFGGSFSPEIDAGPLADDQEFNIGAIVACDGDNTKDYLFIPLQKSSPNDSTGVRLVRFSDDGKYLAALTASTSTEVQLRIFDVKNGTELKEIAVSNFQLYNLQRLSWSSDNSKIFLSGYQGSVLYDVWNGTELIKYDVDHQNAVLMPDGNSIAATTPSSSKDGKINFYSTTTGALIETMDISADSMVSIIGLVNKGKQLYIQTGSRVDVWDLKTKSLVTTLSASYIYTMSRNGEILVTYSNNGTVFFDAITNAAIRSAGQTYPSAISNDHTYVTAAYQQGQYIVSLYDVNTGEVLKPLNGQQQGGYYGSFDFSEDAKQLAAGHSNGILIWNVKK